MGKIATTSMEDNERQSLALQVMNGMQAVQKAFDKLFTGIGLLCGFLFLALGFFITVDVIGRKTRYYGTRVTDEISGYIMVLAATWAFAYVLRDGSHVRVDVLLPFMPRWLRGLLSVLNDALLGLIAIVISIKTWGMVLDSLQLKALSSTYLLTPLWIPQCLLAVGFSTLAFAAIYTVLFASAGSVLRALHRLSLSRKEPAAAPVIAADPSSRQANPGDPPSEGQG